MKVARPLLTGALLLLCGTPAAMAGPAIMATAPATVAYPAGFGRTMRCNILNLNTSPIEVGIEAFNYFGSLEGSSTFVVNPNSVASLPVYSSQAAWCRFNVDGSTKKVRAVAVYDNGSAYTTSQVAR